jgi:hypothetical protein
MLTTRPKKHQLIEVTTPGAVTISGEHCPSFAGVAVGVLLV